MDGLSIVVVVVRFSIASVLFFDRPHFLAVLDAEVVGSDRRLSEPISSMRLGKTGFGLICDS